MFEFLIHVAIMACLYGLLALSLNLQVGFGGLVNFGQVILFGCGTYGASIAFSNQLGPVAGIALGVIFALVVAVAFARLGRNLGADYWGIATLAVAEVLRILANNEAWLTGGAQGVGGIPLIFGDMPRPLGPLMTLGLCIVLLFVAWWLCNRLTTSRYGLALKLMREEPQLAASLGYDLSALKTQTLMVAAVMAAASGFVFAHYITFVGPDQLVSSETFLIWAMVIIGGSGNHFGAIVGAILMQFLFAFVPFVKDALGLPSEYVAAMRLTLVGGGLLTFLMWRTQGLIPERVGEKRNG
ncbi:MULTISPECIES: branched-chain amino acid ABC transporter permease [Hyphomicrobiales]|uniref:branched-chain amino acid ABC transporter permease n=1 Tax=Hyphomicrobiales TaxID=356 RepID=UPI0003813F48|nr:MULTISPECIES: branched-chain amino acid ABC transporter permease [Phyllobacteriaceae]MCX8572935.1 branched-chain amino acid ABC transporter permease [Aminobacter sp. MET-1]